MNELYIFVLFLRIINPWIRNNFKTSSEAFFKGDRLPVG